VFIHLCAALGNRTEAYRRAGYRSKHPAQDAAKLARLPYFSEQIREAIEAQIGGKHGLQARLAQHADGDMAAFEPWLQGRCGLKALARRGVNTALVRTAVVRRSKEGETRRLELHSSQDAIWKLVRMGGYGEGGADPDAPKPAQVSVAVDLGRLLRRRMEAAAGRPPAPGLTASPLLAARAAGQESAKEDA